MDKAIKELVGELDASLSSKGSYIQFSSNEYTPIPFSKENFFTLSPKGSKIVFIDGGNCEILSSLNFSLQFFRLGYCIYEGNKMVDSGREEFFGIITAKGEGEKIVYQTKLFNTDLDIPNFDSMDPNITNQNNRASPSSIASIIRRVGEIRLAGKFEEEYVVIDGNLRAENDFVNEFLKDKRIYGLSKTNELFTEKGSSACVELDEMSPYKMWGYNPVVEINSSYHNADITITKLHPQSKYVFKLETPKDDSLEIVNCLAYNSKDPVFLGYPYGLVQADKCARVTNKEREFFRLKVMSQSQYWDKISQHLNTTNAHEILDNIS